MPEASVAIGLSGPLRGMQAWSIILPGAVFATFAAGTLGGALARLAAGNFAEAGATAFLLGAPSTAVFARFLYDFVPQRAWLKGSILTVERRGRQRQCDLATAEVIGLSWTMPPFTRGYSDAVPVLRARNKGSRLVRLVLRGDDLHIVPKGQLALLAEAIESGPAPALRATKVCRQLGNWASPV